MTGPPRPARSTARLPVERLDAVVFDLDGVLTDTVSVHFRIWRTVFAPVLAAAGPPPLTLNDYLAHVDGRPRLEGAQTLLAARGLAGADALVLAEQTGARFCDVLRTDKVAAFDDAVRLAVHLRDLGVPAAVATFSRHARDVLTAAGLDGLFPVVVDGRDAVRLSLPGKPDPALFLHAANLLGVHPARAVVVEDAVAGVEAGCRGGFGLVVGVDRHGDRGGDLSDHGAELVLEIARFFADLARPNPATGRYEITGVMGPDEFHDGYPGSDTAGVDNNAYTNVMTVWLLRRALEVVDLLRCRHCGGLPQHLGIGADDLARWADITTRMHVPFHDAGIISQFDRYDTLTPFDLPGYAARYGNIGRLDLILAAESDTPNRYQLGKQADVLMLLYLLSAEELRDLLAGLGYTWPEDALRRTVDFYFARMSHGSTLSRVVHAWVHARTDRAASWGCFTEALAADLHDTQGGTTREGIHLGAMAGTIDLAERCYLGLEMRQNALWLNPRLPDEVTRLRTTLAYRGHRLRVTATHADATVAASPCDAAPVTVRAAGRLLQVTAGQTLTVPLAS